MTHDQEEALSLSDRVVVMSEGRIEQVGTPFEIYNFPATPFVASFVGTLNVLPAKVVDAAGGRVSVAGQTIRTPKAIETDGDQPVTVALRPEAVELGEGGGTNRLAGQVEDVSFLGSIVRTRVKVGEGARSCRSTSSTTRRSRPRFSARRSRSRSRRRRRSSSPARLTPRPRSSRRSPRSSDPPARPTPMTGPALHPVLDGIDLVVFDKDGTLISFEAMWVGWARDLGTRLELATRRPVAGDVFTTIGLEHRAQKELSHISQYI